LNTRTYSNKGYRLPWSVRQRFYEHASSQLANGREITEVLTDFRKPLLRWKRRKAASEFELITRRMVDGATLTRAMGQSLTDLERGVLSSGERVSNLPGSMQLILDVREMTTNIQRRMLSSLFSPVMYLISFWVVMFTLGHDVIPQLSSVVPTSQWTGWAATLNVLGELSTGWYGPAVLAAFAAIVAVIWMSLPRWTGAGRSFCDRHVLPYVVYREINGFVWLISLSALMRSGVTDTSAIESATVQASPWLASRLRPIRAGLKNGLRMDAAMRRSGLHFPSDELIDEIGAYVGYPDFADKMESVARKYVKTLERRLIFRGVLISGAFAALMYFAFLVLQLGNNEISSLINASIGAGAGH
jgi:type II secretory pathway component PulF